MRRALLTMAAVVSVCLAGGALYGVSFSIDQGPAGSVPPYNDGTLLVYQNALGAGPDQICHVLNQIPVDALHVGAPVSGLVTGINQGPREWFDIALTGTFVFSLDHGDPFPVGIAPDSQEEVRVAQPGVNPGDWITKTALGCNLLLSPADLKTATEPNMGLGPDAAFDDDVDALDTSRFSEQNPIFFSIDDLTTLVPNQSPPQYTTGNIYVRFPDGGIGKAIDAVTDLGLKHDGDGPGPLFYENDDIDAMILVDLDDCAATNRLVEVTYELPDGGGQNTVMVDVGDAILFSLDIAPNLPYANGGTSGIHHQPSIPTEYLWLSTYVGPPTAVVSHIDLGLSVGTDVPDDIDALALGANSEIPEPATLLLLGTGTLVIIGVARRRRIRS